MEVKFEDYLSEEERKAIVADVFRENCVKAWAEDGGSRLIFNIAHDNVLKLVNDIIKGDVKELITAQTVEVINNLTEYTVFSKADKWGRGDSEGQKVLDAVILESKPLIRKRLESVINSLDEQEITEMLLEEAVSLIDKKSFGKN